MRKKRQPRLTLRELNFRNSLVVKTWEQERENFTMNELARIFRMPLGQFFKILKEAHEKERRH